MNVAVTAAGTINGTSCKVPTELARDLRRADDFIVLAALAIYETLGRTQDVLPCTPERCGLVVGSAFGPMQTNFDVLDQIVNNEPVSPTLFAHSVFNGAAGYLSRIFNIKGSSLTLTDFNLPFFNALQQGCLAIEQKSLDCCFVLQIETYSELLQDARQQVLANKNITDLWPTGCTFWQLEHTETASSGLQIRKFEMVSRPIAAQLQLDNNQQLIHNDQQISITDPLALSREITRNILVQTGNHNFQMQADNCSLTLALESITP